jgi:hypothetical protein
MEDGTIKNGGTMCKKHHMNKNRLAQIITTILLVPFVLLVQIIKWPLKWWMAMGDYLYIRRETKKAKKEYEEQQ